MVVSTNEGIWKFVLPLSLALNGSVVSNEGGLWLVVIRDDLCRDPLKFQTTVIEDFPR